MISKIGFYRYLNNTFWMLGEKIIRVVLGLFIAVWMARYLGPERFGIYNYALSFVTFFSLFSNLGIDKLLVRDLIQNPENENVMLGSSITLRFLGSIILCIVAISGIFIVRSSDQVIIIMVAVFSASFIFKSSEIIKYWFEATVQAKYSVFAECAAFCISVGVKVYLILIKASVIAFAWAVLIEGVFLAFGLIIMYQKKGQDIINWRTSSSYMFNLLKHSWPLILAGTLYTMYTRIDQIMLGEMIGLDAVGVYAAAVKLSEGWYFVPTIIATSLFPALINARKTVKKIYEQRLQHLLNVMVIVAIIFALGVLVFGRIFIEILYGNAYSDSATILTLHIWGGIFHAMSAVAYRYFIAEGLQIYSLYRGLTGFVINVGLNIVLIPRYGVNGAAIATVISQASALYLFNATNVDTKPVFIMQTKALLLYNAWDTFKQIRRMKGS